ncbi:MAG: mechanosensitive ion channel, partial [Rhodospirillaceae bacterium]|nr:mechanosensitive ion channel [Rhodospirillaceae bacterium]
MNEIFNAQQLAMLGDRAWAWVLDNVLVASNAVQLLVTLLLLGVAVVVARRLSPWLEQLRVRPGWTRPVNAVLAVLLPLVWLSAQWLATLTAGTMQWPQYLLELAATLLSVWVVISLVSRLVRDPLWSKVIAWTAWSIAALNILNLLDPTIAVLDAAAITIGALRISLYTVIQSTLALAILLSVALYVTRLLESRIQTSRTLSPSVQVLFAKSLKIVLVSLAVLIAIRSVGIDLTALAVLGGAIGLGIGFGLQKVISNLISGVILLVDKSIKPGDVISVGGTYGWVTGLGGRYVSIVTRDGIEHLIPNETLITERVENWTHSNNRSRLKARIGVHYGSDVRLAMKLCREAARSTE